MTKKLPQYKVEIRIPVNTDMLFRGLKNIIDGGDDLFSVPYVEYLNQIGLVEDVDWVKARIMPRRSDPKLPRQSIGLIRFYFHNKAHAALFKTRFG